MLYQLKKKSETFFMHLKNIQYKILIMSKKSKKKKKNSIILKCRKLYILS